MPNQRLKLMLIQAPGMVTDMDIHHTVMDITVTEEFMAVDIMVDMDIHTPTDTDITSERDLLMLNQKQKHLLTQAHGTDMEDTDIEATDMVDITAVDIMVDMVIHTGMVDTTDTASKYYPTPTTSPNIQHCPPSCKRIF